MKIMDRSWNFPQTQSAYYKGEYWGIEHLLKQFEDENMPEYRDAGYDVIKLYKRVAMNSLKSNPHVFAKIYMMNLKLYFFETMPQRIGTYEQQLPYFYDILCLRKSYRLDLSEQEAKSLLREFYDPLPPSHFKITNDPSSPNGYKVELVDTFLSKIHKKLIRQFYVLYSQPIWPFMPLLLCLISGIITLLARFRNRNAFIMLILTSAPIGHALICSIFSYTLRFVSPTIFIYFLSVALIPLLFMRDKRDAVDI
jgi:hypothetical protein